MLVKSGFQKFETSLLSNYPKRPALILRAQGASPSMRERRSNGLLRCLIYGLVAIRREMKRPLALEAS